MKEICKNMVFDGGKTDWLEFANVQFEFYANVEQYMSKLTTEIADARLQIEQMLSHLDEADCHEYMQRLRALRHAKRQKEQELKRLRLLTGGCDCRMIAEELWCAIEEMKEPDVSCG